MKPKYSQIKKSHTFLAAGLLTASFVATPSVQASDWAGGNGIWSSTVSPGWTVGGVPNAVGAVANHGVSTATVTTQDVVGGVTVGTISLTNNSAHSWTFTLSNGITLNQDNAGSGSARILNTNSSVSSNGISFSSGTLTLADDLLISNTGASTSANGSIGFSSTSVIAGTGNITIDNVLNNTSGNGAIRFAGGTNTFTGNVNLRSGVTSGAGGTPFGNTSNLITLGAEGAGSASFIMSNSTTIANNWVVAAASGGTLTLGTTSGTTGAININGTVTLNGNLTINRIAADSINSFNLAGAVGGTGGITKTGAGTLRLGRSNTYSGITTVSAGLLRLSSSLAMQNSALDTTASVAGDATNGLQIDTSITTLTLGGLIGDKDLKTAAGGVFTTATSRYNLITALTLNPGTGVTRTYSAAITNGASNMTLTKTGLGTQVLSGTNTYTGATSVQAGVLLVDGSTAAGAVTVNLNAVFGGKGTVNGNLTLSRGALFAFDHLVPNDPLDLVGSFALNSSFGVASLRNTSGTAVDWANVAQGTYTLMNTNFVFNSGNISNFGTANQATGLAGGKSAYFQQGSPTSSLQLVVVPEPGMLALAGLGMGMATLSFMKCRRRA